tara:strand:+ start:783032 stop:783823 length:792 start_codon:yes stop_codon:yes gene_type:complete
MNKKTGLIVLASLGAVSTTALGDIESQVVSFAADFEGTFINFDRFDTMGGTRELTGLSLSYDQSISMDLLLESNGYSELNAGDWELDTGYFSIHQFGLATDGRGGDGSGSPPFIGIGGTGGLVTADLGISDGYNGTGVDTYQTTLSSSFVYDVEYDASTEFGQRMLDTFTGQGQLETYLGGFIEGFFQWINDPNWVVDPNNPPDGPFGGIFDPDPYYGIFLTYGELLHSGDITVEYEYSVVPAPAGLSLLAGAGLFSMRRRRK